MDDVGASSLPEVAKMFNKAEGEYSRIAEMMTWTGHECQQLERANASLKSKLRDLEREKRLAAQSMAQVVARKLKAARRDLIDAK